MAHILTSGPIQLYGVDGCDPEYIGDGWYTTVEKGLHQRCVFHSIFLNVAYTRFKADKDVMDALVHLVARVIWCVTLHTDYFSAEVVSPILVHEGLLFLENVRE